MEKTSREKIALIVFLILAIGMGCILFGYVFAGHSWNVTASNIDDAFGNMEGYTAIVYEGTIEEEESTAQSTASASSVANSNDAGEGKALPEEGISATVSPGGTLDSQASSVAPLAGHKKEKEPVALSDVDELYQAKGANVISLHTADPSAYEEGTILKRGGKRYGIFSVTREYSRILIDEKVKYFTDQKVDYVIALCPEESYLKNAENIDIVITTADSTIPSMGESRNGAFYVGTPKIGSVGAILISPSNVVSAKTISEL